MKRLFKILAFIIGGILSMILLFLMAIYIQSSVESSANMELLGSEAPVLTVAGFAFRDLNKNGELDTYEDSRVDIDRRINDLTQQMTLEEKAGLMFITMVAMNTDGSLAEVKSLQTPMSFAFESVSTMVAKKNMNHFNTLQSTSPEAMIDWINNVQKLAERTRLGIPVTLATDPRHGVSESLGASVYTPFYSKWCSTLGFAAIGDTVLVREFGDIARQEYKALGFRLALSPMADLATEPRWWRIDCTFGEDAETAAKLTKAFILGFQSDSINHQSVECIVKHFPGAGPQENGLDAHFPPGRQAYRGKNFNYHLIPFEKGAFPAHVAQVMPYYGIPVGQTGEDVGFGYNKEIITGLLRDKYHFDGVVCTDWGLISDVKLMGFMMKPAAAHGVENLNIPERVSKILNAGCDMFGGEALPSIVVELVKSGKISEERINSSVKRILKDKFRLGLFENPYLNPDNSKIFGNRYFKEKGLESQMRSLVLLKNDGHILPLKSTSKVFLQGFKKEKIKKYEGVSTNLKDADVIILKLNTPWVKTGNYIIERMFHQGNLDFQDHEKEEILKLIRTKPTITVINLDRPAVIPEINESSKGVIADFGSQDDIILDLIFGKFKPTGKLPIELPSSMDAVLRQKEDMPYDSEKPLYRFGYGITY